jgi:hypothetical protein
MKNKRDDNEEEIVEFWRQMGCVWIPMSRTAGFDGVLVDRRIRVFIVEIKNPRVRWKFTEAEKKLRAEIGNAYHTIFNRADAAALIGLEAENG